MKYSVLFFQKHKRVLLKYLWMLIGINVLLTGGLFIGSQWKQHQTLSAGKNGFTDERPDDFEKQHMLVSAPFVPTSTKKPVPRREKTLLSQHVRQIVCDQTGIIWFFTDIFDDERTVPIHSSFVPMKYELARLKESEYEIMYEGEDFTVQEMLFDLYNILWILSDNKLLRFNEPGSLEEIYRLPASTGLFTTIAVDHANTLWIGGLQTGLFKFDGNSWVHYTTSNSTLPTDSMTKIFVDQNNIIWVALWDHQGILKIDGSNWLYYNSQNSNITEQNIWSLTVDHQSHLWIGTGWDVPALSLMKFDGKDWETIILRDSRGNTIQGTVR